VDWLDFQTCFFSYFPANGIVEKFSGFYAASGERPVVFERLASSFNEQDSAFFEDEGSYSEDGPGRVLA
jgi:hypothetical protein